MSRTTVKDIALQKSYSKFEDYYILTKFRLSLMVVLSSGLAYLIASPVFHVPTFLCLVLGGFFITFASNGINQVLEREYDKEMERTKHRPLAAGRMKVSEAILISGIMLVLGVLFLAMTNPISVLLGTLAFILYAFVYTPLKRYSTLSVAVGAIPGALPVLIGTTVQSGELTLLGLTLFGIQFFWQFPHFWAIGVLAFDDYRNAGYKLLPITSSGTIDQNIGMYSALYAKITWPSDLRRRIL